MIYVDEKYLTIAGKKIPGQVQSVTITEEGKIEDKKNSKGKVTKANQPTGFEAAKVEVSMYFEEDGSYTAKEQIQYIQRLFKTTKQKKQKKEKNCRALDEPGHYTVLGCDGFLRLSDYQHVCRAGCRQKNQCENGTVCTIYAGSFSGRSAGNPET